MVTISLKEADNLTVDDLLQYLADNVKREHSKNPDKSPLIRKLLAQATNYIASQVA